MDGKQLSQQEAFDDFLKWVKVSGVWDTLSVKDKNRIITARRDNAGKRKTRRLGYERLKSILITYAPDRYKFLEMVILVEK
jgi:hypothetical protein